VGDVVVQPNLQEGSIENPGAGIFVILEDKTMTNRGNPHMDVIAGFNGGPRMIRPQDVLTAQVF